MDVYRFHQVRFCVLALLSCKGGTTANSKRTCAALEQAGAIRHRSAQYSHEFCDFIRDMLHVNPEERPSVLDALEFTEELLHDEMSR